MSKSNTQQIKKVKQLGKSISIIIIDDIYI